MRHTLETLLRGMLRAITVIGTVAWSLYWLFWRVPSADWRLLVVGLLTSAALGWWPLASLGAALVGLLGAWIFLHSSNPDLLGQVAEEICVFWALGAGWGLFARSFLFARHSVGDETSTSIIARGTPRPSGIPARPTAAPPIPVTAPAEARPATAPAPPARPITAAAASQSPPIPPSPARAPRPAIPPAQPSSAAAIAPAPATSRPPSTPAPQPDPGPTLAPLSLASAEEPASLGPASLGDFDLPMLSPKPVAPAPSGPAPGPTAPSPPIAPPPAPAAPRLASEPLMTREIQLDDLRAYAAARGMEIPARPGDPVGTQGKRPKIGPPLPEDLPSLASTGDASLPPLDAPAQRPAFGPPQPEDLPSFPPPEPAAEMPVDSLRKQASDSTSIARDKLVAEIARLKASQDDAGPSSSASGEAIAPTSRGSGAAPKPEADPRSPHAVLVEWYNQFSGALWSEEDLARRYARAGGGGGWQHQAWPDLVRAWERWAKGPQPPAASETTSVGELQDLLRCEQLWLLKRRGFPDAHSLSPRNPSEDWMKEYQAARGRARGGEGRLHDLPARTAAGVDEARGLSGHPSALVESQGECDVVAVVTPLSPAEPVPWAGILAVAQLLVARSLPVSLSGTAVVVIAPVPWGDRRGHARIQVLEDPETELLRLDAVLERLGRLRDGAVAPKSQSIPSVCDACGWRHQCERYVGTRPRLDLRQPPPSIRKGAA